MLNRETPRTPPLALTHREVTAYLESRGFRFKRKPESEPAPSDPDRVARAAEGLERSTGAGEALAERPRTTMERALGRDFGDVRVHRVDLSPLNVEAASRGRDVYVEPGQARFDTEASLSTLGHELGHVSQRGGRASRTVSARMEERTTDPLPLAAVHSSPGVAREEAEAGRAERTVMRLFETSPSASVAGIKSDLTGDLPEIYTGEAGETGDENAVEETAVEETGPEELAGEDAALSPDQLADSPVLFLRQEMALLLAAQMMMEAEDYPPELYANLIALAPPDLDEISGEGVISEEDVEAIEGMAALLAEIEGLEGETEPEATPDLDRLARQIYPIIRQMLTVERERQVI